MVSIGNWLFHHRNWLFPFFYALLFVPSPLVSEHYIRMFVAGFLIAFIGQSIRNLTIGLVYIIRGGQARQIHAAELHTNGLMAHVRNPLYIGNILILLGLGIASNSVYFLCFVFPVFVFFYQAIVVAEEAYLEKQFGENYLHYKSNVNRWLPNLKGIKKTFSTMTFRWQRVVVAEYNPMFLWLTGSLILLATIFYRNPNEFNFQEAEPYFIAVFIVLILLYFLARFLKKTKRITSE